MAQLETKHLRVTYKDDAATKEAVFQRVMAYFVKHEAFFGESIQQRDATIIAAPDVLADIADDIIGFEIEEKA